MSAPTPPRQPVSIVCVANDLAVRERCLDRSIAERRPEAPETEYLPIDNRGGAFASAGAALNHGASQARHDHVVFVHQDVYLHSLVALEEAAAMLTRRPDIGMHGSIGITADGRVIGRVRDRVVLLGEPLLEPTDVDSLDEVLFMVSRADILSEPLAERPELAWHAYAVEYGLRVRSQARRVTAGSIPLTHNSMSTNLARLDTAHRSVAVEYPSELPVRTTCGVISQGKVSPPPPGILTPHRWRYRWLRESAVAHRARRAARGGPVVLGDIRDDIDDAIAALDGQLQVINIEQSVAGVQPAGSDDVELLRGDQALSATCVPRATLSDVVAALQPGHATLITNLTVSDVRVIAGLLQPCEERVIGYHEGIGCWVLLGEPARSGSARWTTRRSTPLGMAPVSAATC